MRTKWADPLLSTIRGEAFRRSAGEASDQTLAQVAPGLLAVACLLGSGLGVACYGAAKQFLRTPTVHLQHVATAAAINVLRVSDWLIDKPREQTRTSAFAKLMEAAEAA